MDTGAQTIQRGGTYEVLSPWADVDPVPWKGIQPRLKDLEGKTIGLFSNGKRAAGLALAALEAELAARVPTAKTSRYVSSRINVPEILTEGKEGFEAWVNGIDAVVLAVGD